MFASNAVGSRDGVYAAAEIFNTGNTVLNLNNSTIDFVDASGNVIDCNPNSIFDMPNRARESTSYLLPGQKGFIFRHEPLLDYHNIDYRELVDAVFNVVYETDGVAVTVNELDGNVYQAVDSLGGIVAEKALLPIEDPILAPSTLSLDVATCACSGVIRNRTGTAFVTPFSSADGYYACYDSSGKLLGAVVPVYVKDAYGESLKKLPANNKGLAKIESDVERFLFSPTEIKNATVEAFVDFLTVGY